MRLTDLTQFSQTFYTQVSRPLKPMDSPLATTRPATTVYHFGSTYADSTSLPDEAEQWKTLDPFLTLAEKHDKILSFQEFKRQLTKLFRTKVYEGPMPQAVCNPTIPLGDAFYSGEENKLMVGPQTRMSGLYHELTHYEGCLDVAVAQAYYHRLPWYKKPFIRKPAISVAKALEDYAASKNRHLDGGWVQLGYDIAQQMAFAQEASNQFAESLNFEDSKRYLTSREELTAELSAASRLKNKEYLDFLKTQIPSDRSV